MIVLPVTLTLLLMQTTVTFHGGGLYFSGGNQSVTARRCTWVQNRAVFRGGAVFIADRHWLAFGKKLFVDSRFYRNTALLGGAMHLSGQVALPTRWDVLNVPAANPESFVELVRVHIAASYTHGCLVQVRCTFTANIAQSSGGAHES